MKIFLVIMKNKIISKIFIGIIALIASACSNKKLENLGVLKKKANEYSIARKAPLVMPPDMFLSPPQEKEKQVQIKRKKIDDSEVTLDDILLGKTPSTVKKNTRKKIKKVYKKEKIVKKILRTKATIILN
jgi:hypothetical protein